MFRAALLALSTVAGTDSQSTSIAMFVAEHEALAAGLRSALVTALAPGATRTDRAGLVLFLRADVLPHAALEERILYPVVEKAMGTRGRTTAAMVEDHRTVAQLADELAALCAAADVAGFERQAAALGAALESHFEREEEVILPALREHLRQREIDALFARMRPAPLM